jgi:hypothetical protein
MGAFCTVRSRKRKCGGGGGGHSVGGGGIVAGVGVGGGGIVAGGGVDVDDAGGAGEGDGVTCCPWVHRPHLGSPGLCGE